MSNKHIPVYSIDRFNTNEEQNIRYQIEVFDANRHFQVEYPHRHDFYEILFLTNGGGTHTIDFQDFEIKPNSVFFLAPGQVHSLDLSDDIQGYIFLFTDEFYLLNKQDKYSLLDYPFFYNLSNNSTPIYLESNEAVRLSNVFQDGCHEMLNNLAGKEAYILALLDIILLRCSRLYPRILPNKKRSLGQLLVKRFKMTLNEHYLSLHHVSQYADLLEVNPSHLTEVCKTHTGKTSNEIIHEKLIIEAKKLLTYSDLNITQIAHHLKFKDQSYFSKFFKRNTSLSPIDFRLKSVEIT